jgi:hypothetical protein
MIKSLQPNTDFLVLHYRLQPSLNGFKSSPF